MDADVTRYVSEEEHEPRQSSSFFPHGIVAWDQLWLNPQACWPWPYSVSEAADIANLFSTESSPIARLTEIVEAARLFLHAKVAAKKFGAKPNIPREARQLKSAARDFMKAIDLTSPVARMALGLSDTELLDLKYSTDKVQHRIKVLEPSAGGRSENIEEQNLIYRLQITFQKSFSVASSPCRWEDFVSASTDPLTRLKMADGSNATEKVDQPAWRSRLARAQKRLGPKK